VAADYDRRWPRYTRDTMRETLARLGPGMPGAVLDIACGTGTLLEEIARRRTRADARIAGVDLSLGMLTQARRKLDPRAIVVAGDATRLPFRSGAFEVAVSVSALHHWRDPGAVLREARRVLHPGGRLVITDWCGDRWVERMRAALHRRHDGFAGLGEIDPVAQLVENRVHHYAAIGIVFRAKDRQRPDRRRPAVLSLCRCSRCKRFYEHT